MEYSIHNVVWTNEKVDRFWQYQNNGHLYQEEWFTFQTGDGIYNYTRKFIPRGGKILDYGAGKGFLTRWLLEKTSAVVDCAEFSLAGLENIKNLISRYPHFGEAILIQGFPLNIPDESYDCVYFVETLEHLTDDVFLPTLKEFKRILKKGGHLVVTTPNEENLDKNTTCCPDCGCVFHYWQHMRTFTKQTLTLEMETFGFDTVFCGAVKFDFYKDSLGLGKRIANVCRRLFSKRPLPHLVYIGKV
jgi:SAM-dependent methyltransferase